MSVSMVNIRKMRMPVPQPPVLMLMAVRFAAVPIETMFVPMMLIMRVGVAMQERLVQVIMLVMFRHV